MYSEILKVNSNLTKMCEVTSFASIAYQRSPMVAIIYFFMSMNLTLFLFYLHSKNLLHEILPISTHFAIYEPFFKTEILKSKPNGSRCKFFM